MEMLRQTAYLKANQNAAISISGSYDMGLRDYLANAWVVYINFSAIQNVVEACYSVRKRASRADAGKRDRLVGASPVNTVKGPDQLDGE
jgi:hypothetical protein